jgi:tRNA A37 threonylcarbamoyladenosine modification protein TsaB
VLTGLDPAARRGRAVAILIDSRRGPVFGQCFATDGMLQGDSFACLPEALHEHLPDGPLLLAGDGTVLVAEAGPALLPSQTQLAAGPQSIRAEWVARFAAGLPAAEIARRPPAPLYLRPPDVTHAKTAPEAK